MKIKRQWYDHYRAVDSTGATLDFMLRAIHDAGAAEQLFRKVLDAGHTTPPRGITVDKNAAYPPVFDTLQREGTLPEICQLRPWKYLNNTIEPDHRYGKCGANPGLGFAAFATAPRTIQGDAAVHRLHKGQIEGITMRDVLAQNGIINRLFGVAASGVYPEGRTPVAVIFATHSGPWNRGLAFG
jgi:IS6 family transposase